MMSVNWLAVLVSAIAFMIVGFIWYTVFAKQWAAYTGWTREKVAKVPQGQMVTSYVLTFVTALVTCFVLAGLLKSLPADAGSAAMGGVGSALVAALMAWLGFTAAPGVSNYAFERRPWGLLALVVGNTLVSMLVAAVILTLWK